MAQKDALTGLRKLLSLVANVKAISKAASEGDETKLAAAGLRLLGKPLLGVRDRKSGRTVMLRLKKHKRRVTGELGDDYCQPNCKGQSDRHGFCSKYPEDEDMPTELEYANVPPDMPITYMRCRECLRRGRP